MIMMHMRRDDMASSLRQYPDIAAVALARGDSPNSYFGLAPLSFAALGRALTTFLG
jgi:hypothetical protein